jgi:hypothetical protein
MFLSGLFSMLLYVTKYSSVALKSSAPQNENDWNSNKSYAVGGEHRLPGRVFLDTKNAKNSVF